MASVNAVADEYGVAILAPARLVSGLRAPGISGTLTLDQALEAILAGSSLVWKRASENSFVIAEDEKGSASPAQAPSTSQRAREPVPVAEELLVVGTKRGLSVQKTQTSVTVVTEAQIDEQVAYDLIDILLQSPNVTTDTQGVFSISLRGIASGGVGFAGSGQTSNVYIDGAPASPNGLGGAFNLWDTAQVEILRGPQSTTQGRNALAGAVVVQTADPEYEFDAAGRIVVGNNETRQYSAMITGPILEDQVAFRLAADYREQDFDGFNAVVGEPREFSDALTLRGKLLVEPKAAPKLRLELQAQWTDFENAGTATRFIGPSEGTPEAEGFDPFDLVGFDFRAGIGENEALRLIADVEYEFSDHWRGVLLASYDDTERVINNPGAGGIDTRPEEVRQLDTRLQFSYDRLDGWIGAYLFEQDVDFNSTLVIDPTSLGFPTDPPGTIVTSVSTQASKVDNFALYADLLFDLNDKLKLNVGARYDVEDVFDTGAQGSVSVSNTPCFVQFGPTTLPCDAVLPTTNDPAFDTSYEAFLPKAGLIYDIDDLRSLSLTVSRGYRAGGADTVFSQIEEFEPEFLTNYELAFRSLWLDKRLAINANVFFADWTDQQLGIPVDGGLLETRTINAGESELYGLELAMSYEVSPNLGVFANLGLLETEFTDFPFAVDEGGNALPGVPGFANLAGNEFQQAPPVTANAGFTYERATGFFASANASYRGEQFSEIENLPANRTDSYMIVNARLGYDFGNTRVSLFANNLLDEQYFAFIGRDAVTTGGGEVAIGSAVLPGFNISQPRAWGLQVEARFR